MIIGHKEEQLIRTSCHVCSCECEQAGHQIVDGVLWLMFYCECGASFWETITSEC